MKVTFSFRLLFALGAIASLTILGGAYCLEYFLNLAPCPLCILQRYALWGVSVLFWMGVLQNCKGFGRLIYCGGIILFCAIGILFSSRHLWLQYVLPPEATSNCLAGFEKLIAFRSFWEILEEIFTASPECARIDFTFLNLSLPAWSLITFIGFMLFSMTLGWLQIKRRI